MKILFATSHSYLPQRVGGSEMSSHDLATELARMGHRPAVLCGLDPRDWTWFRNRIIKTVTRRTFPCDTRSPYPVFRGFGLDRPDAAVAEVVKSFRPDGAIIQAGRPVPLANAFVANRIRTVLYFRDVDFARLGGPIVPHPLLRFAANSSFTAACAHAQFGVDATVIPPLIQPRSYRTETLRSHVLFINPVREKGLDIALQLAEMNPRIPFLFQEAWPLSDASLAALESRLQTLPNVTLNRATVDMVPVYRKAKVVLVPSRLQEAWGRIVTEAHFSGIPVLATDTGGLPESVGNGGMLVAPTAPIAEWNVHLRRLWEDDAWYEGVAQQAFAYSQRDAIHPEVLARRVVALLDASAV